MKKIEDYLHLYLGCEIMWLKTWKGTLLGVEGNHVYVGVDDGGSYRKFGDFETVKPILRPLSSMTEEESKEFIQVVDLMGIEVWNVIMRPNGFRYLLSKHFDLFGLIESGLAIDATTLQ